VSSAHPNKNVLYPLFLKLEGRPVLVVGAGSVAERKVDELLQAAATVKLVAPEASAHLMKLHADGALRWSGRRFEPSDVDGVWLVVAATGDPQVQRAVFDAAEQQRTFVVAVDDPAHGSAQTPAIVRRDPYVLAISSGGETPALTRLLREMLEQVLPDEDWVGAARALRAKWQGDDTPMESRFPELVRAFRDRARK
jgi:siroheme synthase-like protein